jgi:hypothetical protein
MHFATWVFYRYLPSFSLNHSETDSRSIKKVAGWLSMS